MRLAVIRFPAANCDLDAVHVLKDVMRLPTDLVWHTEFRESKYDAVVLPGGFSYGDHLRGGVIAAYSPAMKEVKRMAAEGKPVLGICNGFQILAEAGLLPGALVRNASTRFVCKWVHMKVVTSRTVFTKQFSKGEVFQAPTAHGEGNYVMDDAGLKDLSDNEQVVFKYCSEDGRETPESNPNGSMQNIAGVCNLEGNVVGLMPHPERASEAIINPFKNENARKIFASLKDFLGGRG